MKEPNGKSMGTAYGMIWLWSDYFRIVLIFVFCFVSSELSPNGILLSKVNPGMTIVCVLFGFIMVPFLKENYSATLLLYGKLLNRAWKDRQYLFSNIC